jgi:hypothetical protein
MSPASVRIADLNDMLRTTFLTGKVVITEGISALSDQDRSRVVEAVQGFKTFTKDNDPYGEHDFGSVKLAGVGTVFWKIDYYDRSLQYGSENPADPCVTTRVITIMMAEEY